MMQTEIDRRFKKIEDRLDKLKFILDSIPINKDKEREKLYSKIKIQQEEAKQNKINVTPAIRKEAKASVALDKGQTQTAEPKEDKINMDKPVGLSPISRMKFLEKKGKEETKEEFEKRRKK